MTDFRLSESPMLCPSGYQFDAYCKYENPDHGFQEFPQTPENCDTRHEAVTALRNQGWRIHNDGTATCPKCMARLKRLGMK